ncbi:MAG: homocysteine S-methyltransferase family protein [Firmicutes bacterium]|nr:homocysteine S-methyltransferase family protein [Bacillota bacterium]
MRKPFLQRLGHEWLFCDGATGTVLQAKGLKGGELPETWNLARPDDIYDLYCGYLKAGSDIINANTFGANLLKYPDPGYLKDLVTAAVQIAKKARTDCGREDAYIAIDIGPTGKLLEPLGDLPFEKAVSLFGQVAELGEAAGADLCLIETMNDLYEAKAAVLGAKERCSLPVCITTTYDQSGKLLTGAGVEAVVACMEGLRVDALGVNCSLGPREMKPIVERLVAAASVPVIVNPNAGLPRTENGETVYDVTPEEFADCMKELAGLGIQVAGGCCGTTPEFIQKTIAAVRDLPFRPQTQKHHTIVTSFSQAVEIGEKPVLIGERINPTGKKKFKEALRNGDIQYILQEGLKEEDQGAHILDVNVGLPEIDEPAMMETVVKRLQGVTALPLQIDTTNPEALERALRCYNGKPMINSVSGKRESIEAVFPLVRKYGGVLVGLCLDEGGIPDTAEGRLAVAEKIYEAADAYGVPRSDIVLDGLAMTVSSDPKGALVTLGTLRGIRDRFHGHSILGVSNISFGLPARELINSNFLTMAIECGLSCAIINPGNEAMMRAYYASMALLAMDENCAAFIDRYRDYKPGTAAAPGVSAAKGSTASPAGDLSLKESVIRGVKEAAAAAAGKELESRDGLTIINEDLIPALDVVGQNFEKKTVFLPQLLMSADAAKAAFAVIREAMKGTPQKIKAKVILATVKGDIHDIGKNIVKVMLENYGYDVIDLGRDVDPQLVADTAIRENVPLVGLSALMTTTVVNMEATIRLLREKKPDTKIVVGGAVMTQEYADAIGADCYAKDAMGTVRYADSLFDRD